MNFKFLILASAVALGTACAQAAEMPIKIGVRIGANTSNISEHRHAAGTLVSHESKWRNGINAGAIVDIPIKRHFYLSPAFYYDYRHNDYELLNSYNAMADGEATDIVTEHTSGSVKTNWFQVPMLMSYRIPAKIVEFQFDFGPYVALGLTGHDKFQTQKYFSISTLEETEIISHDTFGKSDNARYFNIDWGFDFGIGLLFAKHYYVGAHYLLGMRNLAFNKSVVSKAHSRQWNLSIGYNF